MEEINKLGVRNCTELVPDLNLDNSSIFVYIKQTLYREQDGQMGTPLKSRFEFIPNSPWHYHGMCVENKVRALDDHVGPATDAMASVLEEIDTPLSEIDTESVSEFIATMKDKLKDADVDLKDAKRRINAFKGPRRKEKPAEEAEHHSGSEDGSVSA